MPLGILAAIIIYLQGAVVQTTQEVQRSRTWTPRLIAAAAFATGMAFGGAAHGTVMTFCTAPGATVPTGPSSTLPVSACADLTTGDGTIDITLTNLLADPRAVIQGLSDFFFTFDDDTLGTATLASSAGQEITIASDGSFTTGGTVAAGWVLSGTGGSYLLDVLAGPGHAGPAHLIIGPPNGGTGEYTNANSSIAGNGPHNPFLNQTATFSIDLDGITANTLISSATFSFGTEAGVNVPGECTANCTPVEQVPEPGTLALLGLGLLAFASMGLRRRG